MTTTEDRSKRLEEARRLAEAFIDEGTVPDEVGIAGTLDPVYLTRDLIVAADDGCAEEFRPVHKVATGRFDDWTSVLARDARGMIHRGLGYFTTARAFDLLAHPDKYGSPYFDSVLSLIRLAREGATRRRPEEALALADAAVEAATNYSDDASHWPKAGHVFISRRADLLRLAGIARANALRVAGDFAAAGTVIGEINPAGMNPLATAEFFSTAASLFRVHGNYEKTEKSLLHCLEAIETWEEIRDELVDRYREEAKKEGRPPSSEDPVPDNIRAMLDLHEVWAFDLERRALLKIGDLFDERGRHLDAVPWLLKAISLEAPMHLDRDTDIELSLFAVGALVTALVNAGEVESAKVWRPLLGKLHLLVPSDLSAARLQWLDGVLAIGSGQVTGGIAHLRSATVAFELAGRSFDAAHCALDLAEALAEGGAKGDAATVAETAVRELLTVPGLHPEAVAKLEAAMADFREEDKLGNALQASVAAIAWASRLRVRRATA